MSEGELKKRMFGKKDSLCFCDSGEPDYTPKTCKTKRYPTREEMLAVLDEAKKELTSKDNSTFLTDDAGGTTHIAIDIHIFKKWLGE